MTGHEHIIFLWSRPHLRDNIMEKFFIQSIAPQGLMSIKEEKPDNVETVTYQEIFADREKPQNVDSIQSPTYMKKIHS